MGWPVVISLVLYAIGSCCFLAGTLFAIVERLGS